MSKINKLAHLIQNAELADFAPKMYDWYEKSEIKSDTILSSMMKSEKEQGEALLTAFKKQKVVSGLDDADKVRDDAETSFFAVLDGYAAFPLAAKKSAAQKLLEVAQKYRGLTRLPLNKQTAETMSMLSDLAAPELEGAIKELDGVGDLIEKIAAAQEEFRKEEARLVEAKSSSTDSATTLRKKLFSLINDDIIPYLNIASKHAGAEYEELSKKIATEVEKTNLKASVRDKTPKQPK